MIIKIIIIAISHLVKSRVEVAFVDGRFLLLHAFLSKHQPHFDVWVWEIIRVKLDNHLSNFDDGDYLYMTAKLCCNKTSATLWCMGLRSDKWSQCILGNHMNSDDGDYLHMTGKSCSNKTSATLWCMGLRNDEGLIRQSRCCDFCFEKVYFTWFSIDIFCFQVSRLQRFH